MIDLGVAERQRKCVGSGSSKSRGWALAI